MNRLVADGRPSKDIHAAPAAMRPHRQGLFAKYGSPVDILMGAGI